MKEQGLGFVMDHSMLSCMYQWCREIASKHHLPERDGIFADLQQLGWGGFEAVAEEIGADVVAVHLQRFHAVGHDDQIYWLMVIRGPKSKIEKDFGIGWPKDD